MVYTNKMQKLYEVKVNVNWQCQGCVAIQNCRHGMFTHCPGTSIFNLFCNKTIVSEEQLIEIQQKYKYVEVYNCWIVDNMSI